MVINEQKSGFENVLQSGKTAQGGIVSFVAQKTKNVLFPKQFLSIPKLSIVIDEDSNSIPYTINVTAIGFTIKFRINYTGNVSWSAIQV